MTTRSETGTHTWHSRPQDGSAGHCFQAQVFDAQGKCVAVVEPSVSQDDATKIARLMAAAPDLLAVAQMVEKASMSEVRPGRGESSIGWQSGDGVTCDSIHKAARAAISKATKVQP